MQMPGGGVLGVGPGQITDDSEMALCLARGLIAGEDSQQQGAVADKYLDWLQSRSFDIGTGAALWQLSNRRQVVGCSIAVQL